MCFTKVPFTFSRSLMSALHSFISNSISSSLSLSRSCSSVFFERRSFSDLKTRCSDFWASTSAWSLEIFLSASSSCDSRSEMSESLALSWIDLLSLDRASLSFSLVSCLISSAWFSITASSLAWAPSRLPKSCSCFCFFSTCCCSFSLSDLSEWISSAWASTLPSSLDNCRAFSETSSSFAFTCRALRSTASRSFSLSDCSEEISSRWRSDLSS